MLDNMFRKIVVLVIIILLIGLIIWPNINCISNEKETLLFNKKIFSSKEHIFDKLISFLMKLSHIPSLSACIIKNDKVVWAKGYGLYDIRLSKNADYDTVYAVASISKTVTATALMQLYDDGLFNLDDDINDYINFSIRNPNFPDTPITFRMLLAHHSSLSSDNDVWHLHKDFPGDCPIGFYPFLKEYLNLGGSEYFPEVWSNSLPGEEFHYSGIGYAIIGLIIEQITGEKFDEYCTKNIFSPLEMNNSSFRFADIDIDKIAVPYIYCFWGYEPYMHAGDVDYPSGCLRSSIEDLSHFLIAHMNNGWYQDIQILNNSTIKLMHSPQFSDGRYGLGLQIWKKLDGSILIGHTGSNIGVSTLMKYDVFKDVSIVYFINRKSTLYSESMIEKLIEKVLFIKGNNY